MIHHSNLIEQHVTYVSDFTPDERNNVELMLGFANKAVKDYFNTVPYFDIIVCRDSWDMELQIISRRSSPYFENTNYLYYDTRYIGFTDFRLEEIVIRTDRAKFGHYLHELIHGITKKGYTHQLKEGLAWYFTMKLTENCRYVRPGYPSWVDKLYLFPVNQLARLTGEDFLKDLILGNSVIEEDFLPGPLRELFLPEIIFYSKSRY